MDSHNSPQSSGKGRAMFPPLMNTIDTYLEAGSEDRSQQIVESSKSTGKKKKIKKVRRKKLLAPLSKKDGLEEVSELTQFSNHGVGNNKLVLSSPKKSKSAGKLDHNYLYPEQDDDDRDNFSAMEQQSYESPLKPVTPGGMKVSSHPRTSPRAGRVYKEPGPSKASSSVDTQRTGIPAISKGDASFNRAIESIAALKLHNYAMRRRQHIAQKIKMLKEIRSFEREGSEEFVSAQKLRANEVIAAWRIRYYVELYRFNVLKRAAEMMERHNQHLDNDLRNAREVENFLRQEIEDQKYSLTETTSSLTDFKEKTSSQACQVIELTNQLQETQHALHMLEAKHAHLHASFEEQQALREDWESKHTLVSHELHMTRATCQEMIKHSAKRENAYQANIIELETLQEKLSEITDAHESLQQTHKEVLENASMREEDVEIRIFRYNQLMVLLQEKDDMIRRLKKEKSEETKKIEDEQRRIETLEATMETIYKEKGLLQIEKESMHRVIGDLALQLQTTQHSLSAEILAHQETQQQMEMIRSDYDTVLQERDNEISLLEEQLSTSEKHISTIKEENNFLGHEIEGLMMEKEDFFEHFRVTSIAYKRNLEFSRFLEEELYAARHHWPGLEANKGQYSVNGQVPLLFHQQLAAAAAATQNGASSTSPVQQLRRMSLLSAAGGATPGLRRSTLIQPGMSSVGDTPPTTTESISVAQAIAAASALANPGDAGINDSTTTGNPDETVGGNNSSSSPPVSSSRQRRRLPGKSVSTPTIQEHDTYDTDRSLLDPAENDSMAPLDPTLLIAEYMEQKFGSIVNILEDKLSSVDKATSTLKILMEKAESLERMQNTRRNNNNKNAMLSPQENPLIGVRRAGSRPPLVSDNVSPTDKPLTPSQMLLRQASHLEDDSVSSSLAQNTLDGEDSGVSSPHNKKKSRSNNPLKKSRSKRAKRTNSSSSVSGDHSDTSAHEYDTENESHSQAPHSLSPEEENQRQQNVKQAMIDEHIHMERIFLEMQATLQQIGQELHTQKADITQLQDVRNKCKQEVSRWKKDFRRLNNQRDPTDEEIQMALGPYLQQIEQLRDQINYYKANNLTLNAKAIAIQTELYHVNAELEASTKTFAKVYEDDNITNYYPEDLLAAMQSSSIMNNGTNEIGNLITPPFTPMHPSQGFDMGKSFSHFLDDPLATRTTPGSRQWMSPTDTTLFATSRDFTVPNSANSIDTSGNTADNLLAGAEDAIHVFGQDTSTGADDGSLVSSSSPSTAKGGLRKTKGAKGSKLGTKSKSKAAKQLAAASLDNDMESVGSSATLNDDGTTTKKTKRSKLKKSKTRQGSAAFAINPLDDDFGLMGGASSSLTNNPDSILENPYLQASDYAEQDFSQHPLVKTETQGVVAPIDLLRHGTFLKMVNDPTQATGPGHELQRIMENEVEHMRHTVEEMATLKKQQSMLSALAEEDVHLTKSEKTGLPNEDSVITMDEDETHATPAVYTEEEEQAATQRILETLGEDWLEAYVSREAHKLAQLCLDIEREVQQELLREKQRQQQAVTQATQALADAAVSEILDHLVDELIASDNTEQYQWSSEYLAHYDATLASALRDTEEKIIERLLREEIEYLKEEQRLRGGDTLDWSERHHPHPSALPQTTPSPQQTNAANALNLKKKAQELQQQQRRQETLRHLQSFRQEFTYHKAQVEAQSVLYESLQVELQAQDTERLEMQDNLLQWRDQFESLCGRRPDVSDMQRSVVYRTQAEDYGHLQSNMRDTATTMTATRALLFQHVQEMNDIHMKVKRFQEALQHDHDTDNNLNMGSLVDLQEFLVPSPESFSWKEHVSVTYYDPMSVDFPAPVPDEVVKEVEEEEEEGEEGEVDVSRRSVSEMNLSPGLKAALGMTLKSMDLTTVTEANNSWVPPSQPGLQNSKVLITDMPQYFEDNGWSPGNHNNHHGNHPLHFNPSIHHPDYYHPITQTSVSQQPLNDDNNETHIPQTTDDTSSGKQTKIRRTSMAFVGDIVTSAVVSASNSRYPTPTVATAASVTIDQTTEGSNSSNNNNKENKAKSSKKGSVALEKVAMMTSAYGVSDPTQMTEDRPKKEKKSKSISASKKKQNSVSDLSLDGSSSSGTGKKKKKKAAKDADNTKEPEQDTAEAATVVVEEEENSTESVSSSAPAGESQQTETAAANMRRASVQFVGGLMSSFLDSVVAKSTANAACDTDETRPVPPNSVLQSLVSRDTPEDTEEGVLIVTDGRSETQQQQQQPSLHPIAQALQAVRAMDFEPVKQEQKVGDKVHNNDKRVATTTDSTHPTTTTTTVKVGVKHEDDDMFDVDFSVLDHETQGAPTATSRNNSVSLPSVSSKPRLPSAGSTNSRPNSRGHVSHTNSNATLSPSSSVKGRVSPNNNFNINKPSVASSSPSSAKLTQNNPDQPKPTTPTQNKSPTTAAVSSTSPVPTGSNPPSRIGSASASTRWTPSQLEALKLEYVTLRRELRDWKHAFVTQYFREPTLDDFKKLPQELQIKIARKNKLKKVLTEKDVLIGDETVPSPGSLSGKF